MDRFAVLLRSIVRDPDLPLSALPLLPEAERAQLLAWNDTAGPGCEPNLFELFAAQVARTPAAEAVAFEGERLTYGELHGRAVALARRLVALGVGPEVLVGVAAERSLELLVGLLAVLAAGGAYVPLEPSLPAQRLAMVLEDARPAVLLTRRAHAEALGLGAAGARLVWLDGVADAAGRARRPRGPLPRADADNAGLRHLHLGLDRAAEGGGQQPPRHRQPPALDAGRLRPRRRRRRRARRPPFGFDVSVPESVRPLLLGARLVVARPEGHKDSAYLVGLVRRKGSPRSTSSPRCSPLPGRARGWRTAGRSRRVLAQRRGPARELPSRAAWRRLAGAADQPLRADRGRRRGDRLVRAGRRPGRGPVPIGRPIANTRIHSLDAGGWQPVPVGVRGRAVHRRRAVWPAAISAARS